MKQSKPKREPPLEMIAFRMPPARTLRLQAVARAEKLSLSELLRQGVEMRIAASEKRKR